MNHMGLQNCAEIRFCSHNQRINTVCAWFKRHGQAALTSLAGYIWGYSPADSFQWKCYNDHKPM